MPTTQSPELPADYEGAYNIVYTSGNKGFITPWIPVFQISKTDGTLWRTFQTRSGYDRFVEAKGLEPELYEYEEKVLEEVSDEDNVPTDDADGSAGEVPAS